MADVHSQLEQGLKAGLYELLDDRIICDVLDRRSEEDLFAAGRRAVQLAIAPFLWEARLGPMLDTAQVCDRLGVSRQAVAKAVNTGRLLALPAGNTRHFPTWQFSFGERTEIRREVGEVLRTFRDGYPEVRPLQIASWAMTPQPELKDETPAAWIERGAAIDPLLDTAGRTASGLAQ
jgi:hypothetical protein